METARAKRAYFITATGTDLGKTWLTAGVARLCRQRGIAVRALKPVSSGYDPARHGVSDAGQIAPDADPDSIAPWRFAAPLSPDRAAAREGRNIDFPALAEWCRSEIERNPGLLLIEGVGGVMVPLDAAHTVRDWMAVLRIPVVLVAGTYLGALSHTLTALAALREVGLAPTLVAVNESPDGTVSLADTLASLLPHLGAVPVLTLGRDDAAGLQGIADFLLE